MYELKIYLTEKRDMEDLCFHAWINDEAESILHSVFFDLNNMYESLLKTAMDGSLSIDYIDPTTFSKNTDFMNVSKDLRGLLLDFKYFLVKWYHLVVDIREVA